MSTPDTPTPDGADTANTPGDGGGQSARGTAALATLRRVAPTVLVVLGSLLALLSVAAIWAERQAVDTGAWRSTADRLIRDGTIQDALALYITDQIYANVDVTGAVQSALPKELRVLAAPAAGALREAIQRGAEEAVQRPRVQRAWSVAVTDAQKRALKILEGGGEHVTTHNGAVVINLQAILYDIADQVGFGGRLADALPPDVATIEILRSDELSAAQTGLRLLRDLAIILPLVTLLIFAAAIWLAAGRRRETVRLIGIGLATAAILILVIRTLAGGVVIDAIDPEVAFVPAAEHTWEIATTLLRDGAIALLVYALLILVGTSLMGPTRAATAVRRRLRPATSPQWAYPVMGVVVLLLLWWGPTEGLRRWLPALILIALLVAGLELLRRQVEREAAAAGADTQAPDLRALASSVTAPLRRLHLPRPTHDRLADLERLKALRDSGALSAEEYDAEKRRILSAG